MAGMVLSSGEDLLEDLQSHFALYDCNGKYWIVDKETFADKSKPAQVSYYDDKNAQLHLERYLETLPIAVNAKEAIKQFRRHPNTEVYRQVVFNPNPVPGAINLWRDPAVEPANGDHKVLHDFINDVICSGLTESSAYLFCFLAHMLQRPAEKPGVMPVLMGGQGTGKGTFFKLLNRIFANSFIQVNDVNHVISNFNAQLETAYVVCMDEAMFSGDKKSLQRLKSLITEPQIRVEQKYQPARNVTSLHRFFAATNDARFTHTEFDDRRFLYLEVSSHRKKDYEYFAEVLSAIADDSQIGSFVSYLNSIDLSDFNVFELPKLQSHLEQRLSSLSGFERFWFEVLNYGNLCGNDNDLMTWDESTKVKSSQLMWYFECFDKHASRYEKMQIRTMTAKLKKLCPSVSHIKFQDNNKQVRGIQLPSLTQARAEFEVFMQAEISWS